MSASAPTAPRQQPIILRKTPFQFLREAIKTAVLSDDVLHRLVKAGRDVGAKRNQVLIEQGTVPTAMLVIMKGVVLVMRQLEDGKQTAVGLLGPGSLLAADTSFNGASTYSYKCMNSVRLLAISRTAFDALREVCPEINIWVHCTAICYLQMTAQALDNLNGGLVKRRLARLFVALAKGSKIRDARGLILNMKLSRADLGLLIGTSSETVSREMTRWGNACIETRRSDFVVFDLPQLEAIAGIP